MALSEVGEMAIRDQEERLKHKKDDPARFLTGIYGIDGLSGRPLPERGDGDWRIVE